MRQQWLVVRRVGEAMPSAVHMLCALKGPTRITATVLSNITTKPQIVRGYH